MEAPNIYVYNAMIRGCVLCSFPIHAIEFYMQMLRSEVAPTSYTFSSLIKACVQLPTAGLGEVIHGRIWICGFESQLFVQTALIDYYVTADRIKDARKVFNEMPERDVVAWTAMISGYARVGDLNSAERLFHEMPERSTVTWNTMVASYVRSGDIESAASLFNQMPSKDLVSWTTMISGYSQSKRFKEAIKIFQEMKIAGISPDEVTLATVISACAHIGALDMGREIHINTMWKGFELDVYTGSALIDMYAKCGSIERSLVVFYKLHEKNLFCWNSIIEGLAVHGYAKDALAMFNRMERYNIMPNGVTFVSVLSACTHAGLVEEGIRRFLSMANYSIPPEIEHYGCMVDLLGRAGHLNDALELIRNMKMEPNSAIWGALLSSCKIHANLKIGEVAVKKLMVLEPDNSGYYLLLINMYAEANRWNEVALTRAAMKGRGVEKRSRGCSWIELEGNVHEFAASDILHPSWDEICLFLVEIDVQLKVLGHRPDMEVEAML